MPGGQGSQLIADGVRAAEVIGFPAGTTGVW